MRNHEGELVPSLAVNWAPSETNPNIWVFNLREGVTYHDGAAFTAEDVVFSLNRAMTEDSDYKELLASVKEVRADGDYTVEIETNGPNPIMPNNLTNMFNVKTVLAANENYWGKGEFPLEVTEIVYTPIQNAATRVAALLSGEVDFIQDVPVQDLERVASTDGLDVRTAPQNRVIFFGMNMGDEDLANDDVEGTNPFADVRVRRAMNLAINRDAIKQVVMRGQSEPAGMIAPPFVNGWNAEMDAASTTDKTLRPISTCWAGAFRPMTANISSTSSCMAVTRNTAPGTRSVTTTLISTPRSKASPPTPIWWPATRISTTSGKWSRTRRSISQSTIRF